MAGTAFVTGGTGFLGLNLVEQLRAEGWEVVAFHRPGSKVEKLAKLGVRLVEGNLHSADSVAAALPERVDAVFHVAANVSLWRGDRAELEADNIGGTRAVVEAALRQKARRLIHTSSAAVWGFQPGPFDETAPKLGRKSWVDYMRTKTLAEDEVREGIRRGLDAVLLHPAGVVGPHDTSNWLRLARRVKAGEQQRASPGANSFTHVREAARAHLRAVERGRTGEDYLLSGADGTHLDVLRILSKLLGQPEPLGTLSPTMLRWLARLMDWRSRLSGQRPALTPESAAIVSHRMISRSDKAVRELDYRIIPLEDMLREYVAWLQAEKLL